MAIAHTSSMTALLWIRRDSGPYWNQSSRSVIGYIEVAVQKTNASKSLAIAMAVLAGATGFFLIGGKEPDQARADKGAMTETTATAAGAQLTPTEPKLRVEPK